MKGYTYDAGFDFALRRLKAAVDIGDFDLFFNWDRVVRAHEETLSNRTCKASSTLSESPPYIPPNSY